MPKNYLDIDQNKLKLDLTDLSIAQNCRHTLNDQKQDVGYIDKDVNSITIELNTNLKTLYITGEITIQTLTIMCSGELVIDAAMNSKDLSIVSGSNILVRNYIKSHEITISTTNNKLILEKETVSNKLIILSKEVINSGLINSNSFTINSDDLENKGTILVGSIQANIKDIVNEGDLFIESGEMTSEKILNNNSISIKNATLKSINLILNSLATLSMLQNAKVIAQDLDSKGTTEVDNSNIFIDSIVNSGRVNLTNSILKATVFFNKPNAILAMNNGTRFIVEKWYKEGICDIEDSKVVYKMIFDKALNSIARSSLKGETIDLLPESHTNLISGEIRAKKLNSTGAFCTQDTNTHAEHFNQDGGTLILNKSALSANVANFSGKNQHLNNKSVINSSFVKIGQEVKLNKSGIHSKRIHVSDGMLSLQSDSAIVAKDSLILHAPLVIDKSRLITESMMANEVIANNAHVRINHNLEHLDSLKSHASHFQINGNISLSGNNELTESHLSTKNNIQLTAANVQSHNSQISAKSVSINNSSEITGKSLDIKAEKMTNNGTIAMETHLGISAGKLTNYSGTLESTHNLSISADQYVFNMLGLLRARNLQLNSGMLFTNLGGVVESHDNLNLTTAIANNTFGAITSLNLNVNTFLMQNYLGLLMISLPDSLSGLFTWQRLTTFTKMSFISIFPGLSKWINLGFEAIPLLKNTSLLIYDAYSRGFFRHPFQGMNHYMSELRNMSFADYLSHILLLKNVAVSRNPRHPLFIPDFSLSWSDISPERLTGETLVEHASSAFAPTLSMNNVMTENSGIMLSHNLSFTDMYSNNNGMQYSTGMHYHMGHNITNKGIKRSNRILLTAEQLENLGLIKGEEKNWLDIHTIANGMGSQFDIGGGVIKAKNITQLGNSNIQSTFVDTRSLEVQSSGNMHIGNASHIEADTIDVKQQGKVEIEHSSANTKSVKIHGIDAEISASTSNLKTSELDVHQRNHLRAKETVVEAKQFNLKGNLQTNESVVKVDDFTAEPNSVWQSAHSEMISQNATFANESKLAISSENGNLGLGIKADKFIFSRNASIASEKGSGGIVAIQAKQGNFDGSTHQLAELDINIDSLSSHDANKLLSESSRVDVKGHISLATNQTVSLNNPVNRESSISLTAPSIENNTNLSSQKDINLHATTHDMNNKKLIAAGGDITLEAKRDILQTLGSTSGKNVTITSIEGNVLNVGGNITAQETLDVEAKKDVVNNCDERSWRGSYDTEKDWTAGVMQGNEVAVRAGDNIINDASKIHSSTHTELSAGKNIISKTRSHTRTVHIHKTNRWGNAKNHRIPGTKTLQPVISSSMGNQKIEAKEGSVHLEGTKLLTSRGRTTEINAGKDVTFSAKIYSETYSSAKNSLLTSMSITRTKEYAIPTEVSGNLKITSGGKVNISGTHMQGDLDAEAVESIDIEDITLKERYQIREKKWGITPSLNGITLSHQQTDTKGFRETLYPTTFTGNSMRLKAPKVSIGISAHIPELTLKANDVLVHGHHLLAEEKSRFQGGSITVNANGIQGASYSEGRSSVRMQTAASSRLSIGHLEANVGNLVMDNATVDVDTASGHIKHAVHKEALNHINSSSRMVGINTEGDLQLDRAKSNKATVAVSHGLRVNNKKDLKIDREERQKATPYEDESHSSVNIPVGKFLKFAFAEDQPTAANNTDNKKQENREESNTRNTNKQTEAKSTPNSTTNKSQPKANTSQKKPNFIDKQQTQAPSNNQSESQRSYSLRNAETNSGSTPPYKLAQQPPMVRSARNIINKNKDGYFQQQDAKTGRFAKDIRERVKEDNTRFMSTASARVQLFKIEKGEHATIVPPVKLSDKVTIGIERNKHLYAEGKIEASKKGINANINTGASGSLNYLRANTDTPIGKLAVDVRSSASTKAEGTLNINRDNIDINFSGGFHASALDAVGSVETETYCLPVSLSCGNICAKSDIVAQGHVGAVGVKGGAGIQTLKTTPGVKFFVEGGAMAFVGGSVKTSATFTCENPSNPNISNNP